MFLSTGYCAMQIYNNMYVVPITQVHMCNENCMFTFKGDQLWSHCFCHTIRECSPPFKSSPHFEKGHIKVPTPPIPHKNNQSRQSDKILEL